MMASFFGCQPDPVGGDLEGSSWTLASAKMGTKPLVFDQNTASTSLLFEQGRLTGAAPCNEYGADFTTKDASISLGQVSSTKRACDGLDLENEYLSLLGSAKAYSILKDQLVIFCEKGKLTFVPMPAEASNEYRRQNGIGKLEALFPVAEGDQMPHLFPILKVDNPGEYPYLGEPIDTAFYKYFDENTKEVWGASGGDVLAVARFGVFFLCRVPGRYVSSDLAIFREEKGRLKHVETVAWAWCDEGWCFQQDAWLKDVNLDGRTDLIQHYTLTNDRGKVTEERLTVLEQDANGDFMENKAFSPDKNGFKMAKI